MLFNCLYPLLFQMKIGYELCYSPILHQLNTLKYLYFTLITDHKFGEYFYFMCVVCFNGKNDNSV